MTEQEAKAIKWIKSVRDDAVVTLDHIKKNEPNVSPVLYAGRKERAEAILNAFEELEQYRELGAVEELREAKERQIAKKANRRNGCGIRLSPLLNAYGCPNCEKGFEMGCERYNYCPGCGQAIDWSDI